MSVLPPEPAAGFRLAVELDRLGADLESLRPVVSTGVPRPVQRWQIEIDARPCLIEQGLDADGRRRLVVEGAGRAWASRVGVCTPEVLASHPDQGWLVSTRGEPARLDADVVDWAMTTADRIAGAPHGPGSQSHASQWRTTYVAPLERARRAARMVQHGLNPHGFLRARRDYASLTDRTWAHGDFYERNVVLVGGRPALVDWEYAGQHPRFTDHVRFWTLLPADLRPDVIDRLRRGRTVAQLRHLGVVLSWLSMRILAENLSVPATAQNPADLEHARALQAEARFWAEELRQSR